MSQELIKPIVTLLITFIVGGGFLIFMNKDKKKVGIENKSKKTAQEFINVKDIKDKFLYTLDKMIMVYVQVPSIDINLLSKREKELLTRTLTSELSSERKEFMFLAVSRPVDVSPLIAEYQSIITDTTNQRQKELLRNEISALGDYAISGEVVERQFYFMFWEKYEEGIERDLLKRAMDFCSKFDGTGIKPSILTENKIIRLCNLINNPAYTNSEDTTYEPSIPIIAIS